MGSQRDVCAALYRHCLETPDEEFSQTYLLSLEIIPENNVKLLFDCMSTLCSQRRFIRCQGPVSGAALWKVVKKEDTARSVTTEVLTYCAPTKSLQIQRIVKRRGYSIIIR